MDRILADKILNDAREQMETNAVNVQSAAHGIGVQLIGTGAQLRIIIGLLFDIKELLEENAIRDREKSRAKYWEEKSESAKDD